MAELVSIGIRLPKKMLKLLEEKAKEENIDRSTAIRQMIANALGEYKKEKAARLYSEGKVSISGAAEKAEISIREMIDYLLEKGYKSSYTYEDLKRETETLG
jgi:metal-responsive CopG/Arc/MetJ family transcriptional regulator